MWLLIPPLLLIINPVGPVALSWLFRHVSPFVSTQDVMREEVKYTDSVNPLEMFLKGDYIMKTEEVEARCDRVVFRCDFYRESMRILLFENNGDQSINIANSWHLRSNDLKYINMLLFDRMRFSWSLNQWIVETFYGRWTQCMVETYGIYCNIIGL